MTSATRAEFLDRKLFGLPLLVFAGRIVTPLAAVTLKSNQVAHCSNFLGGRASTTA
jgi:hypothetical protein